ncbi:hypothetical protein M1B34_31585 [Pseudomonas sp. MAFF 302030]|uniref:Tail fiber protein n=1 Tax=Pseudomonas morbosilactucae TaxID=2938197 RepID=A0A9X1Z1K3_9PSED|nr:hypothetical protein [Pseudomonas morbosilactucae]MCK9802080.1 hypothetical protein [Pseudomonas morbosilactucae]
MNNPSVGYPLGSFKNRTAPAAKDGSYLEQDWANDKEGFFQSLLSAAGLDANGDVDRVGASQFFNALLNLQQGQAGVAFQTGGTSTALTLAPTPEISGYSESQRFSVKFSVASGLNPTLNVSAKGAKSLKQYDSTGAKVAAIFSSGQVSDVVYDGVDFVVLDPLPPQASNLVGIQGNSKNLLGVISGTNTIASYSMDEVVVKSAAGNYKTLLSVSISPSISSSGANGLDAGVSSISTWYSVWVIWNGATVSGLFSLSDTAPSMPAGYTHKARVGWVRTDATASKFLLGGTQVDSRFQYKVSSGTNVPTLPIMAQGSAGSTSTPTWSPVSVAGFVPTTAKRIIGVFCGGGGSGTQLIVAPNNSYGGYQSTTNPPPVLENGSQGSGISEMILENSNIYYASNSGSNAMIACFGWEDSL